LTNRAAQPAKMRPQVAFNATCTCPV